MLAIGKILATILSGPIVSGVLEAYKAKLAAGTSADSIAGGLAARELDVQNREAELQTQLRIAQIGKWYEPEHIIGYTMAVYLAKVYLWDAALHLGSTDEVRGAGGAVLGLVVVFYFGKRGIENVARIIGSFRK